MAPLDLTLINTSLSYNVKFDPWSYFEEAIISPPRALDKFLLIGNPKPTPYLLRLLLSTFLLKGWKTEFNLSVLIPTPVSCIEIAIPLY